MAAVLFHRTAQRKHAIAEARSSTYALNVGADVAAALADLGQPVDVGARAEPLTPAIASVKPFVVVIGDLAPGFPAPIAQWPTLELDGTTARARVIRDALLSFIVILAEQHGWIDSTERWAKAR